MVNASVSNIILQKELERTSVAGSGPVAVAVSDYVAEGGGAVAPSPSPISANSQATNKGGGVPSSSLDHCDQVGRNESFTPDKRAETRAKYKQVLVSALNASGRHDDAARVAACAEDFKVGKCLDCGAAPAFPISCDHRLCPDCAARRAAILVSQHEDMLKQLRYPKMMTLTFLSVRHLDEKHGDKVHIKWARDCFTKLRHRKVFKNCWGGIYSFEATYSVENCWHLHIHCILGSGYIDQAELSKEWEQITGAHRVWIQSVSAWAKEKADRLGLSGIDAVKYVKDAKWNGVREVVKYPAKIATFLADPALVNEFLLATKGINLAYGFGAMYRVRSRRHAGGKMSCPVCGGNDISFRDGFGFCVPKIVVTRVKGGWLWRPPPHKLDNCVTHMVI